LLDSIKTFSGNARGLHKTMECMSPELGAVEVPTVLACLSDKRPCSSLTGGPVKN